jgi:hypothetical protein
MVRGRYLREELVPLIAGVRHLLDEYTAARFDAMCENYKIVVKTGSTAPG